MVYRTYCDIPHTISWTTKCHCGIETRHQHTFKTGESYPPVRPNSGIVIAEVSSNFPTYDLRVWGQIKTSCKGCGALKEETLPPLGILWFVTKGGLNVGRGLNVGKGLNEVGNEYLVNQELRKRVLQDVADIDRQKSFWDFFYHSNKKAADIFHAEWVKNDIAGYDIRKAQGLLTDEEKRLENIHHYY